MLDLKTCIAMPGMMIQFLHFILYDNALLVYVYHMCAWCPEENVFRESKMKLELWIIVSSCVGAKN